jgi:hypothetical protein
MGNASIPNPSLQPLARAIGTWTTEGRHPFFPDAVLRGKASFEWLEGGAFILMRAAIDHPAFPAGLAVIGTDDAKGTLSMLYFDERKVSREYEIVLREDGFQWRRTAPDFSQQFTVTFDDDGRTMRSNGEMSRSGGAWEADLGLMYTRTDAP